MSVFRIIRVVALCVVALVAWAVTVMLSIMCLYSIVLGPVAIGVFAITACVAALAFCISTAAVEDVSDLWSERFST
jgi:hypothetical protein